MSPSRCAKLSPWLVGLCAGLAVQFTWAAWAVAGGPFTPNGTQPPIVHEIEYAYADPGLCENCHGNYDTQNDIEPFNLWSGTMMANAGRDPVFWAAVDVANQDLPGVGEFCLRCHAPKAWLEGRASAGKGVVGDADGCALEGDINVGRSDTFEGNDFEGVTCHFCHRMMINEDPPPGEQGNYLENAQYWIDDGDCATPGSQPGPCRRGPYDYPPEDPEPPHNWAWSDYHTESQFCATCHNVTNPVKTLIDENGDDTGIPYPIERTHAEWLASDYAVDMGPSFATCQGCHMPDVGVKGAFACVQGQNDRTGNMPGHYFVGGNTWVPALLREQYGTTIGNSEALDNTITRAQAMLEGAAQVALTAPPAVGPGGTLGFQVRVTNLGGHKLPTGYNEGRRMWIQVEVVDGNSDVIWESGAYDQATGELTRDAQIKVYESRRGIWNALGNDTCDFVNGSGVEEFHFVLDDCIALDNRIPPLGFTGGASLETRPVGYEYPETFPGSGILVNYDDTGYSLALPIDAVTPLTVRATLRYQTSSKEYIEYLRDAAVANNFPDDDFDDGNGECTSRSAPWTWPAALPVGERSRGEFLYWLWENENGASKSAPVDMAVETAVVAIDADIFSDGFESGDVSAWDGSVGF
jgi:hypothetical protein